MSNFPYYTPYEQDVQVGGSSSSQTIHHVNLRRLGVGQDVYTSLPSSQSMTGYEAQWNVLAPAPVPRIQAPIQEPVYAAQERGGGRLPSLCHHCVIYIVVEANPKHLCVRRQSGVKCQYCFDNNLRCTYVEWRYTPAQEGFLRELGSYLDMAQAGEPDETYPAFTQLCESAVDNSLLPETPRPLKKSLITSDLAHGGSVGSISDDGGSAGNVPNDGDVDMEEGGALTAPPANYDLRRAIYRIDTRLGLLEQKVDKVLAALVDEQ